MCADGGTAVRQKNPPTAPSFSPSRSHSFSSPWARTLDLSLSTLLHRPHYTQVLASSSFHSSVSVIQLIFHRNPHTPLHSCTTIYLSPTPPDDFRHPLASPSPHSQYSPHPFVLLRGSNPTALTYVDWCQANPGSRPSFTPRAPGHRTDVRRDRVTSKWLMKYTEAPRRVFGGQLMPTPYLWKGGSGSLNWCAGVLIMALQGLSCRAFRVRLWSSLHQPAAELKQAPVRR